jgi:hypothetical protein
MKVVPSIIEEIQKICNLNNKEIFVDLKSLKNDCVYPVNTDSFIGFIYVGDKDEQFLVFNDKIFKYAFTEGYNIDNIYKFFNKKLFYSLTKEQFIERLLK